MSVTGKIQSVEPPVEETLEITRRMDMWIYPDPVSMAQPPSQVLIDFSTSFNFMNKVTMTETTNKNTNVPYYDIQLTADKLNPLVSSLSLKKTDTLYYRIRVNGTTPGTIEPEATNTQNVPVSSLTMSGAPTIIQKWIYTIGEYDYTINVDVGYQKIDSGDPNLIGTKLKVAVDGDAPKEYYIGTTQNGPAGLAPTLGDSEHYSIEHPFKGSSDDYNVTLTLIPSIYNTTCTTNFTRDGDSSDQATNNFDDRSCTFNIDKHQLDTNVELDVKSKKDSGSGPDIGDTTREYKCTVNINVNFISTGSSPTGTPKIEGAEITTKYGTLARNQIVPTLYYNGSTTITEEFDCSIDESKNIFVTLNVPTHSGYIEVNGTTSGSSSATWGGGLVTKSNRTFTVNFDIVSSGTV